MNNPALLNVVRLFKQALTVLDAVADNRADQVIDLARALAEQFAAALVPAIGQDAGSQAIDEQQVDAWLNSGLLADTRPHGIYIWTQGGSGDSLSLIEAAAYLQAQRHVQDCQWEVREPGIRCESDGEFHNTLDQAVNSAVPDWEAIGLTWLQAALIAQDTGLVLSTGAPVDESDDELIMVRVEYAPEYFGGDYTGVGEFVNLTVADTQAETIRNVFSQQTGIDPVHIIHWDILEKDESDGDEEEDWLAIWREQGDDMPCPECGAEQIETQDGLTVCRACGWQAKNPLANEGLGDDDKEEDLTQNQDQPDTLFSREQIITAARAQFEEEGTIEIDDNAVLSRSEENEDEGLYVQAWVWVRDDDIRAEAGLPAIETSAEPVTEVRRP